MSSSCWQLSIAVLLISRDHPFPWGTYSVSVHGRLPLCGDLYGNDSCSRSSRVAECCIIQLTVPCQPKQRTSTDNGACVPTTTSSSGGRAWTSATLIFTATLRTHKTGRSLCRQIYVQDVSDVHHVSAPNVRAACLFGSFGHSLYAIPPRRCL